MHCASQASNEKVNEELEARWGSGVFFGINEANLEIVTVLNQGSIESQEVKAIGSEEEGWNLKRTPI